jgi:hypothetical protein
VIVMDPHHVVVLHVSGDGLGEQPVCFFIAIPR